MGNRVGIIDVQYMIIYKRGKDKRIVITKRIKDAQRATGCSHGTSRNSNIKTLYPNVRPRNTNSLSLAISASVPQALIFPFPATKTRSPTIMQLFT